MQSRLYKSILAAYKSVGVGQGVPSGLSPTVSSRLVSPLSRLVEAASCLSPRLAVRPTFDLSIKTARPFFALLRPHLLFSWSVCAKFGTNLRILKPDETSFIMFFFQG